MRVRVYECVHKSVRVFLSVYVCLCVYVSVCVCSTHELMPSKSLPMPTWSIPATSRMWLMLSARSSIRLPFTLTWQQNENKNKHKNPKLDKDTS